MYKRLLFLVTLCFATAAFAAEPATPVANNQSTDVCENATSTVAPVTDNATQTADLRQTILANPPAAGKFANFKRKAAEKALDLVTLIIGVPSTIFVASAEQIPGHNYRNGKCQGEAVGFWRDGDKPGWYCERIDGK